MTVVDQDSLRYFRIVMEAYMRWRLGGTDLGIASFASIVGIAQAIEDRQMVDLSTDDFTLIDHRYAKLQAFDRAVLDVEYNESGSVKQKARFFRHASGARFAPDEYRATVANAEVIFYDRLLPEIDGWERAKPMRRKGRG